MFFETSPTIIGWPSRQGSGQIAASQSCDCSKCRPRPFTAARPVQAMRTPVRAVKTPVQTMRTPVQAMKAPVQAVKSTGPVKPVPQRPACPTCGMQSKGCITLKGFALNSALLEPFHKQQLKQLAATILQQNSNAVIATGFTNSSRTEQVVESLGERRALAVIMELKRQLARLRPNAHKNIFWKTSSKTITQPTATVGAAGNRRVEICIRRLQ